MLIITCVFSTCPIVQSKWRLYYYFREGEPSPCSYWVGDMCARGVEKKTAIVWLSICVPSAWHYSVFVSHPLGAFFCIIESRQPSCDPATRLGSVNPTGELQVAMLACVNRGRLQSRRRKVSRQWYCCPGQASWKSPDQRTCGRTVPGIPSDPGLVS